MSMHLLPTRLATLLIFFVTTSSMARVLTLFNFRGEPNRFYNATLGKIQPQDILRMPDDAEFEVVSTIKEGNTTALFQVIQRHPPAEYSTKIWIRLPLEDGVFIGTQGNEPYFEFINKTIDGELALNKTGIPHPKVLRSMRNVYAVVEDFPHDFSAREFFLRPRSISPETLQKAEKSFYRFIATTAPFSKIGDFQPQNIVYNTDLDEWKMLDWTNNHLYKGTVWKGTALDYLEERLYAEEVVLLPRHFRILKQAREVVQQRRWVNFGAEKCGYVYSIFRKLIPGFGRPIPVPQ